MTELKAIHDVSVLVKAVAGQEAGKKIREVLE